ncbi:Ribosomal protein L3, bacterial/organelle-type [Phytophthora cactorum]|nr:Ribosomal protein L3, bacterial/organelle-type [Phytophthora cactorum]
MWRGSSALVRSSGKSLLQTSSRASLLSTAAAPATAAASESVSAVWSPEKKRTGLLAVKIGMMPVWDHFGYRHNCTVLQVEECQVTQVKTATVTASTRCSSAWACPVLGHLSKAGVPAKRQLQEFRVSEDALLPLGTTLSALHFNAGQYVDVCGISKGKGFQGVMKLHNFAGQPASHGNSKTQRHMGSTGQCQDPGKVFKGKKMPGRMGGNRVTRDNLWIAKIDVDRNLIYVKGSKKPEVPLPYPTFVPAAEDEALPSEVLAPHGDVDPYHYDEN